MGVVEGKRLGVCMKINIVTLIFLGALLVSCNSVQKVNTPSNTENLPTPSKENIPTKVSTPTATPTVVFTSTPSPYPTTIEEATIEAFGTLCIGSKYIRGSETSPDSKWIAAECYRENGQEESPLQVVSIDGSKNWKIYVRDYKKGDYDRHDTPIPYRWSKDGRFLYAMVGSRFDGCCWVGRRYVLLVRLNLETGKQIALLNTGHNSGFAFDAIISDSDRYLFFTPPSDQSYNFAIQDLQSWKTRTITLKFKYPMDLNYSVISPDENKILVPLFKFYGTDFKFKLDSITLIDLKTNEQKLLISGLSPKQELYPVRWLDNSHVLLNSLNPYYRDDPAYRDSAEDWIINTNTGELVKSEKP